ncbi:MAG: DUF2207 domain-containing protein, partial [Acidimicrobiia bacterium]|nr:DUF2207 domain-containing protein [Acidimicrobiia bacterium]
MRRAFRIAGGAFVAILFIGGILAAQFLIPKKAFTVPRVAVDATLAPDGTMRVIEHITYDFTGSFTYGTRPIPVGAYSITDMQVSEHDQPLVSIGAPYNLQWYFTAENETRTFDVAYTVAPAAIGAPDVAAVYWKWVGTEHPTIGLVTATLHTPPGAGTLRAWGHGPLAGTVTVGPDTVRWRAPDVPTGTFVEGRVTVPAARLPGLAITAPPQLTRIVTEESAWAKVANDTRAKAARDAARQRSARAALTVIAPLLVLCGAFSFFVIWRRFGKEPEPAQPVGEYVRDLPDDPPAVVDGLMHWGTIGSTGFSATVLDLAQRGFLTVREVQVDRVLLPDRTDYEMTATNLDRGSLLAFERTVLDQVFAAGSPVMQSEISKYARKHQT